MVALLSNLVSNVPAVLLLRPVVLYHGATHHDWILLAMASTLAGNLTITGSVANIIVVESARHETRVSFWNYLRVGVPVTLVTLGIGAAWLYLFGMKRQQAVMARQDDTSETGWRVRILRGVRES